MDAGEQLERAQAAYERAVFGGEAAAVEEGEAALDVVEAELALARGRLAHARFLSTREVEEAELGMFERAAELFARVGDGRGQAEAEFWVATYHQVVGGDHAAALPHLERAETLARAADDRLTLSYVLRHLNFVAHAEGRTAEAEDLLHESTRLRRDLGFAAGVAANLIGHAYLAAAQGRAEEVPALLEEAEALAAEAGARGVQDWIAEARRDLLG
ncbi:tetratricopeptide repeat protein [Nocardioides sp.]|uniref:tetratricopeptide repeat protein n=1 Tax=Nocardioides sp. TaxID=35761 RepID=UPI002ED9DC01